MKRLEIAGQKFNRLTAVRFIEGEQRWECRCDCGSISRVKAAKLRRGDIKSCGCLLVDFCKENFSTHGYARPTAPTNEYAIWGKIKSRCHNPNDSSYDRYGARGITVHPAWLEDFTAFFTYLGPRPSLRHSIDRIDGNKGYEPGNVRWATKEEQANNRSNNVPMTWDGETMNLSQWAQLVGMSHQLLWARLNAGWSFEIALITPTRPRVEHATALRRRKAFLAATEPK